RRLLAPGDRPPGAARLHHAREQPAPQNRGWRNEGERVPLQRHPCPIHRRAKSEPITTTRPSVFSPAAGTDVPRTPRVGVVAGTTWAPKKSCSQAAVCGYLPPE